MAHAMKELLPTTHDYIDENGDIHPSSDDPDGFAAVGKGDFSTYEYRPAEASLQQEIERFLAADYGSELSWDDFEPPRRPHTKHVTVRERELLAIREAHLVRVSEMGAKAAAAASLLAAIDAYCGASELQGMLDSPEKRAKLTEKKTLAIKRGIGHQIGVANEHLANGWGAHTLREAGYSDAEINDRMVPVRKQFRGALTAYGVRESHGLTAAEKLAKMRETTNRRARYRRHLKKVAATKE